MRLAELTYLVFAADGCRWPLEGTNFHFRPQCVFSYLYCLISNCIFFCFLFVIYIYLLVFLLLSQTTFAGLLSLNFTKLTLLLSLSFFLPTLEPWNLQLCNLNVCLTFSRS